MNKKMMMLAICSVLLFSSVAISMQTSIVMEKTTVHRGSFQAEIGIREDVTELELEGIFRDFRGRHVLAGSISPVDSDRSSRFQGFISRNHFIIQTSVRNNIVNIFGRFNEYDEGLDEYHGNWRGFVVGIGRTSGWITASFSS
jgi:hypothetical protein